ncbi:MAG TPA: adenylate/guanylate cyclase domain-containing protein [Candidatus Acidoferrum sp.]|jgi:adenylate cyclase|nr:adenylate/guanylate cyclase domain-containing protein [Candidatus Acidoferrum sp.]
MRITCSYRDTNKVWQTSESEVIVGRSEEKGLIILDLTPDQRVSRLHARLWEANGTCWIEDLNSSRGTTLNGVEIKGRGKQEVPHDASVVIGQTTLKIEREEARDATHKTRYLEMGTVLLPEKHPDEYSDAVVHDLDATDVNIVTSHKGGDNSAQLFKMVCELPFQLATKITLESLLPAAVDQLVEMIPKGESWMLALFDKRSDALQLKAYHCKRDIRPSETLFRRSMAEGKAFIWRKDTQADMSGSILQSGMESGIYAPLLWRGEALGAVCVTTHKFDTVFGDHEVKLLVLVAQCAAMCIAMHQLRERLRQEGNIKSHLLRQFSPKVADKLLSHKGGVRLGGRRNEVTILNSDIRGFTNLARDMEPDEVVEILNEYWRVVVPVIFAHNGTIDKFMGDALLAVFGSPEADPNQQQNAVRAALEMQTAIANLNDTRRAAKLSCCDFGIGIHCGQAVHGFVGTTDRMEFTVIGDAVNRTQRYCAAAAAHEVLISNEVRNHVKGLVETEQRTIQTKHEGELIAYRVRDLLEDSKTIDIRISGAHKAQSS